MLVHEALPLSKLKTNDAAAAAIGAAAFHLTPRAARWQVFRGHWLVTVAGGACFAAPVGKRSE
jgi:hypothetical protein